MPKLEEGLLGDVVGFGPVGTRLLVPRPNGGVSRDVAGFCPVGTCLLSPKESTLQISSHRGVSFRSVSPLSIF